MSFEYDVFFSYRHKTLDAEITQKLFNLVENYRLPAPLKRKGYAQFNRAFRDTEELPVSRILTDTIDQALHSTNCLVVVCSLDTPSSEWVDREVETFIMQGRADHIFPVLITGDPDSSFPKSLKLVPDIMERLIDVRSEGNAVRRIMAKAETGMLKVVAAVAGCGEAELLREHKIRKNTLFVLQTALAAGIFAAAVLVSLGLMKRAENYRERARLREGASLAMIRELTYDLPDKLVNIPGAYSQLSDILYDNTLDLNQIILLSKDQDAAEYEIAANYEKLATSRSVLGSYEDALEAQQSAIAEYEKLNAAGFEGGQKLLGSAYNNRGNIYHLAGRYREAAADYSEAIRLVSTLAEPDPYLLSQVTYNAGGNMVSNGQNDEAEGYFISALDCLAGLEETADVLNAEAGIDYNYGVLLFRSARYDEAVKKLKNSAELYRHIGGDDPSRSIRSALVRTSSMLA
ncbi:MAG: TIR domain-containing protein, partial [Oscillospiraceae bacterium]|nr:TIR domain-containing protein [Oscillospiraceae bacterium]